MMMFDDKKALDETEQDDDSNQEANDGDERDDGPAETNDDAPEADSSSSLTPLQKRQKWIPYIIFVQDVIFALGSGMTIKFFPLFFKDEVGMSPTQVQVIFVAVPITMAICSTLSSKVADSGVGRVQTQILSQAIAIALLYAMVFFKQYLDKHPVLLVPIYVFRTSLMNATYPLQESILMDFVPKEVRARWKSLDAVASFGWCGSAAFGGWLADKYDYTYTFFLTAVIQTVGLAVFALLLPLVPRHENASTFEAEEELNREEPASSADTLTEPLLPIA